MCMCSAIMDTRRISLYAEGSVIENLVIGIWMKYMGYQGRAGRSGRACQTDTVQR